MTKLNFKPWNFAKAVLLSTVAFTFISPVQSQPLNWVNRTPNPVTADNNPSGRRNCPAMAFDSFRARVVLFGGSGGLADTWERGPNSWTNQTPPVITSTNNPPARYFAAMAYDSARKRCVLFGGYGPGGARLRDTWEYDGNGWEERTPSPISDTNSPQITSGASMVYDSLRQRIVMFGSSGIPDSYKTWEWDGNTWTDKTPKVITAANNPSGRVVTAMAFDSRRGRTVLFGGLVHAAPGDGDNNETWEWDGTSWVNRTPSAITASNNPSARARHSMAYDAVRGRVVLFGGTTGPAETWEWDGTSWTNSTPSPVTAENNPSSRNEQSMVYDAVNGRIIMFGGEDGKNRNETWTLGDPATYADLSVHLSAEPANIFKPHQVVYTVIASNRGAAGSGRTTVTLPLPAGTTYSTSAFVPNWSVGAPPVGQNGTVTLTNTGFATGQVTFEIYAAIESSLALDTTLSATATIDGPRYDPSVADRSSTASFRLSPDPSLVVTTREDSVADDGVTSLREAISRANANPDNSFIRFGEGMAGTISLQTALPPLSAPVEIQGPGAGIITITRAVAAKFRIFEVAPKSSALISGLAITNGDCADQLGGGVYNDHGALYLKNCTISGNKAGFGGGVYSDGQYASGAGTEASLTLTGCTLSGNTSVNFGGGLGAHGSYGDSSVTVLNCTFSGNQGAAGGAIGIVGLFGKSVLQVDQSTFSDNVADSGSALYLLGSQGAVGSNVFKKGPSAAPTVYNSGPAITRGAYNVFNDNAGGAFSSSDNKLNVDPKLGPLAENGGLTQTHALLKNSPAINAGDPNIESGSFDQRGPGFPRITGGRIDAGAFESDGPPPPNLTVTVPPGYPATFSEAAANPATRIRVTRAGSTATALAVTLSSDAGSRLKIPAGTTIKAGQSFQDINVTAVNDTYVDGTTNVKVTATAPGYAYLFVPSGTLHVTDDDGVRPSLAATFTATFPENRPTTVPLTVTHNRSFTTPVALTLASTDPRLSWPAVVTISAGARKVVVPITVTANPAVQGPLKAQIKISATGFTQTAVTATITDAQAALTLAAAPGFPTSFSEAAGPAATKLRVSRNTPPATPVTVTLSCRTGGGSVTLPQTVTIPVGKAFVDFAVAAVDNSEDAPSMRVVIDAKAESYPGSGSVILAVRDDDAPAAGLAAPPSPFGLSSVSANAAKGTVTLTFTGPVAASAGDPSNYELTVNGTALEGFGVSRPAASTVVIQLGSLSSGDSVSVAYNLKDSSGRGLAGTAKTIAK